MKKIYRIEQENNGGLDFNTYEGALENITKQLHDEANYMYSTNKDNVYLLYEINVINEDEDNYEEEYIDTLVSISVKDYKDMNLEEKNKIGLKY